MLHAIPPSPPSPPFHFSPLLPSSPLSTSPLFSPFPYHLPSSPLFSVADLGGGGGVQMHPPLAASNVFRINNCTSPSNGYTAVECSNNNHAQLHTHISAPYLSPDVPRVASRYSVRTLHAGSGRGNPRKFRMHFAPVAEPPFLNFFPISSSTSQLSSLSPSQYNDLLKKKHIVENNKSKIGELITELDRKKKEAL